MENNLKNFIAYYHSDEELEYYIRINADWNEESFIKLKKFHELIVNEYPKESYPKVFKYYFTDSIDRIINIISNNYFYNGRPFDGFTQEDYKRFLDERIRELSSLKLKR